jgi:hypothetical protein
MQLPAAGKIGARPCMRVRICSLHPRLSAEFSRPFFKKRREPLAFASGVTVVTSILADDGRYPLPVCRFCPPEVAAESSIPRILRGISPSLRSGRSILQLPAAGKIGACSDFPTRSFLKKGRVDRLARSARSIPHLPTVNIAAGQRRP